MTQKNMNIEKILGAGRQEIVSDLTKSCFSEKRLQKLENTGQEKKTGTGTRHEFQEKELLNSVRDFFFPSVKDSPEEKESRVRK